MVTLKRVRRSDAPPLGKVSAVPLQLSNPVLYFRKTADQTVTNSTTLVNDARFELPVGARQTWTLEFRLLFSSSAVANIKWQITIPALATGRLRFAGVGANGLNGESEVAASSVQGASGTGANKLVVFHAHVVMGTTAGDIILQWAQNTAEASNTIVRQDSLLIATRIV